jgi:uncharacterized protein YbjT (DUF2867 family)
MHPYDGTSHTLTSHTTLYTLTMVCIAVITGSSASGIACIKKLLSNKTPGLGGRGCFRSQERADAIRATLGALADTDGAYESHVGVDANNVDTLKSALKGADRALFVTPLDYSAGMQNDARNSINMIQAAKEVGVKRIVHVGSWTVNAPDRLPILCSRFKPTEEYLKSEVGDQMEWTVLRGGYFMSNFATVHLANIREKNEILAVPDCRIPAIDVRDIGEAAAALLGGNHDENYIYHKEFIECCGPTVQSHGEIAAELGAGLGRTITYPDSPNLQEWCKSMKHPVMLELFKYMADESTPGLPFDPERFARVLGRPPTSIRSWAEDNKDVFAV